MQNRTNFNYIAPFYDTLCQLVFGQRVKNAQIESLKFIPANSTILIAGGGTGWILDEINKIYPSGLTITYIDISSKMIQLSKKRNPCSNTIQFINYSIENINLTGRNFDVIITPFFLDCFSQISVQFIFKKLDKTMQINGLWLNIDFCLLKKQPRLQHSRQRTILRTMYAFFRLVCHIEATMLPSVDIFFANYSLIKRKMYCNNFITMQVFQKKAAATY